MAGRKTYGVFLPDGRWGRTNSLAEAKKAVDKYGGTIRSMSYLSGSGAWDAPTFRVSSDLVPYVSKKPRVKSTKKREASARKK